MSTTLYNNSIYSKLESALLLNPQKILIKDFRDRTLTGAEILQTISALAIDLVQQGVKRGQRVLFLAKPSIESILYFFALSRAGAVIVLVDPEMGDVNFKNRVEFSKCTWMLQDKIVENIEFFSWIKPVLHLLGIWFPNNIPIPQQQRITIKSLPEIKKLPSMSENTITFSPTTDTDDMAIIFTSGSTGTPKGVVHSYQHHN